VTVMMILALVSVFTGKLSFHFRCQTEMYPCVDLSAADLYIFFGEYVCYQYYRDVQQIVRINF